MEGQDTTNSSINNSDHINHNDNNANSSLTRAAGRWTCEACGCHTNQLSDRNCTICGTSITGPSILRRSVGGSGVAASLAARAGWLARGLGATAATTRRGIIHEDLGSLDDEDLWDSVLNGNSGTGGPDIGDQERAIQSLVMEVAGEGIGGASGILGGGRSRLLESRQRFMDAARAFSHHRESYQMLDPDQLFRYARENAANYQPVWANPTSLLGSPSSRSTRSSSSNSASGGIIVRGIDVNDSERTNLAHLPLGAYEGLAIRAASPLPRSDLLSPYRMPSNTVGISSPHNMMQIPGWIPQQQQQQQQQRRIYGFRVAFDNPMCEHGSNMGGCYLVGVTTSTFTAFGDPSGLQQSPYFWGIDDGGFKYEGPRYHAYNNRIGGARGVSNNARQHQRHSGSTSGSVTYSAEISPSDAPRNDNGVLFGSREVVTVVIDFESRSLTFWRDDVLLGTLVRNLPRNGNVFPVAVPFSCGATVAITGLDNDPLPILRSYASDWKRVQKERDEQVRHRLAQESLLLVQDGRPTLKLLQALKEIFMHYFQHSYLGNGCVDNNVTGLKYTSAARLWYRCGMKLSDLNTVFMDNSKPFLLLQDFLAVICKVLEDEHNHSLKVMDVRSSLFLVGDKVELVEGYEKLGDASDGPLQPGDRGIIVDLQHGSSGEVRSIRVLHSGRRWWYQPHALISEQSALFESPDIWFVRGVLRAHGYDHVTLRSLAGRPVSSESWQYGDIVTPLLGSVSPPVAEASITPRKKLFGRIVPETNTITSLSSHSRDTGTVFVEHRGHEFAEAVGTKSSLIHSCSTIIECRRVRTSKLMHASLFDEMFDESIQIRENNAKRLAAIKSRKEEFNNDLINEKIRAEVAGLSRLERSSIDAVMKEGKKSCDALASLFSAGLADAILAGVNTAERQMNSFEPRDDVAEKILALGGLVNYISEQLFSKDKKESYSTTVESSHEVVSDKFNSRSGEQSQSEFNATLVRQNQSTRNSLNQVDLMRRDGRSVAANISHSLQQRRNMILNVISRARHGESASYLNEAIDGRNDVHANDFLAANFAPFVFESSADFMDSWSSDPVVLDNVNNNNPVQNEQEISSSETEASMTNLNQLKANYTFLDHILRCRCDGIVSQQVNSSVKHGSAAYAIFARRLISCGILVNNVEWTKAIIDEHSKKMQQASIQRPATSLRNVVDEEGTPLLQLAISLGCSMELIELLISYGCPVGQDELRRACQTNQPLILAGLLQHTSYHDDLIDLQSCSSEVRRILEETKTRQTDLDKKMRETAGVFVASFVRKLFKLCLSARRNYNIRLDQCSKAICEVLVGNVLLRAVHKAQSSSPKESSRLPHNHEADCETRDRSGRFSVEDSYQELHICPKGLLGLLPAKLLYDCFLSSKEHFIQYMVVIEEYLYSKDMADAASGFSFLLVLLKTFPVSRSSIVMERFGISDLISYHNDLNSRRIAELLSKQISLKLKVTSMSKNDVDLTNTLNSFSDSGLGVVMCPKEHVTVLHITRHPSFRCDLCGNGVERARPMHGCRECDWDACEDCTDKAECGLVKASTVKGLAMECTKLLETNLAHEDETEDQLENKELFQQLIHDDNTSKLRSLGFRLLQRNVEAAKELGELMKELGQVTIHQFLTIILPSLHASLVGRADPCALVSLRPGHQSKKPRRGDCGACSQDIRLEYCRAALRSLVMEPGRVSTRATLHTGFGSQVLSNTLSISQRNDENQEQESEDDSREIGFAASSSEILRRLHQILSLNETVQIFSSTEKRDVLSARGDELQSLTKVLEIELIPSSFNGMRAVSPTTSSMIYAESLLPIEELKLHVIRAYRPVEPQFEEYCKGLARDKAIIIERPRSQTCTKRWQLGRVVDFDPLTGSHSIVRALEWTHESEREHFQLSSEPHNRLSRAFNFSNDSIQLVLASREYYILERDTEADFSFQKSSVGDVNAIVRDMAEIPLKPLLGIGTRVESNCGPNRVWDVYTLVGARCRSTMNSEDDYRFILVSDEGEVYSDVTFNQIRVSGNDSFEETSRTRRRSARDERSDMFPFFAARQRAELLRGSDENHLNINHERALKRSWSALGLMESMRPIDLSLSVKDQKTHHYDQPRQLVWKFYLNNREFRLSSSSIHVEAPMQLNVVFSTQEKHPGMGNLDSNNKSLIRALKEIHTMQESYVEWPPKSNVKLYFSVCCGNYSYIKAPHTTRNLSDTRLSVTQVFAESKSDNSDWCVHQDSLCRKLSSRSIGSDDENLTVSTLCDGIDELCMQCMEVISLLAECAENNAVPKDKDDSSLAGFANVSLSKKLTEQLDDALCVVGGILPDWCVAAPTFAPRVFTYDSRRALLEMTAFGVSRSTLKQQEAKINVSRLRQRMASLRARAVELVGEAFSGGAEDPTALQLQADELYGMEEALAAKVRAAFRTAKWQEHSLQVAKAVVRRDYLLTDAASVMEMYANDARVCHRRLEVRFDGESGFDAASGDEAGVTRGFYADIAEALLSSENVAGVYCASKCSTLHPLFASIEKKSPMEVDDVDNEALKLPLWIPDFDNSAQVVLPTPRADKKSALGVFPRPIPSYHPQMTEVLQMFRFMGRVFASAMRDGFMFPLPLSSSFLKLVQHPCDYDSSNSHLILTPADLPRPGFLGGEVHSAYYHICRALDDLDSIDPPLSRAELQRRYEELETDKNFGRLALGKSYDLSFKEYFEDRTFVDPLDPSQGEDAVPLCPKGHLKPVTIYNIREWVSLATNFILHEGVVAQALAFRRGVEDFFPPVFLRLFTAEELQRDVCGVGGDVDNWDEGAIRKLFKLDGGKGAAEALVAVAAIGGEGGAALSRRFGPSSPTIAFLIKALLQGSPVQRRQFLSFVTSVPIVTPGKIEVVPMVSPSGEFLPMNDPSYLPRANTCSRRLYLPKFDSFESFSDVLWAVVREESKFKGFYEWRGN